MTSDDFWAYVVLAAMAAGTIYYLSTDDEGQSPPQQPRNFVPADNGGDLDCADIGKMIYVGSNDPNHLDGDGDGWGCESYG